MILKTAAIALAASALQTVPAPVILTPLDPIVRPMVVEMARDPITDAVSAFAVARSPDGRLSIGCDPDRYRGVRVVVHSQGWFAPGNFFTKRQIMAYRFDRAAPEDGRWQIDENAAILRPTAQAIGFVNSAAASGRVTIRTKDIEDREKDLTFSLLGGAPAIQQMLRVCAASA